MSDRINRGFHVETDGSEPPLIVTLTLDPTSKAYFDELRARHFPPERNYLSAHLTLFHALPAACLDRVKAALHASATTRVRFPLRVTGLRMLGYGVAYRLESPELVAMHRRLAAQFEPWLTRQDRQALSPHVTVQNKVAPSLAKSLHAELLQRFSPFEVTGVGLDLWRYMRGPWGHVAGFAFGAASTDDSYLPRTN